MTEPVITTTVDDHGIALITMNRPKLRNAFNEEIIHEICESMGRLNSDTNVRAIALTGAGNAFSAGADLSMMQRAASYSSAENKDDARRLAHMLISIYDSPKPTIALVNGPAMGGGLGLIAACDIAVGVEEAFFALSEVRVGLIPAVISPFVLQAIGTRQARRYFISGERFDAVKAMEIGLLHQIVPANQLDEAAKHITGEILSCAPNAIIEAKQLIGKVAGAPIDAGLMNDVAERIAKRRTSAEGKEGVSAYLEKRTPSWIRQ